MRYVTHGQGQAKLLIYYLGDLGMDPSDVESNLELNFQLAQSWGCVLLLDEADVFLAERLKPDVKRNALVSGKFGTTSSYVED